MTRPHETQLFLSVSHLYRQRQPVFTPYSQHTHNAHHNGAQTVDVKSHRADDTHLHSISSHSGVPTHSGKVIVPSKCRTRAGDGQFLLMGRIRLKRAYLSCALRVEEFERLWVDVLRTGGNKCVL